MVGFDMLRASKKAGSHLRTVQTYLAGILMLTFLLFSLTLVSMVRQELQLEQLSAEKLRHDAELMAAELEQEVARLAADCLDPDKLLRILPGAGSQITPETHAALEREFKDLKRRFPLANHFFVVRAGEVVYPRLEAWPAVQLPAVLPSRGRTRAEKDFMALFARGEKELAGLQVARAIEDFRKAGELPIGPRAKGLALRRMARAMWDSGRQAEAVSVYRQLLDRYGDQYSENQSPHVLEVAVVSESVARPVFPRYSEQLGSIYRDLIRGRWNLSAAQVEEFARELEKRLGLRKAARPKTDYLEQFELARGVAAQSEFRRPLGQKQIHGELVLSGGGTFHTLSVPVKAEDGHEILWGFSLDMGGLQGRLERRNTGPASAIARMKISPAIPALGDTAGTDPELEPDSMIVPFKSVLAPWSLRVPLSGLSEIERTGRRELFFLGLSAAMFLCIMGLGVYLLFRVMRDLHWVELRSAFVHAVSHELKTPLSLIRLYSETLAGEDGEFGEEERRNCARIIARESRRLGYLLENVLDYANIERGLGQQEARIGDLGVVIRQTLQDYSKILTDEGFTVKAEIQPFLPLVRFDRADVTRVLVNLLDNAKKYSGRSRAIEVRAYLENNDVALEVKDFGVGIPAEERNKIFEPFYQISDGRPKTGSGLGLYLVRHVMDGLGGRVELTSEVGHGSIFTLYFPVAESPPEKQEQRSVLESSGSEGSGCPEGR